MIKETFDTLYEEGAITGRLLVLHLHPFFFSSRRRHTRYWRDWSSDVCSSDLAEPERGEDVEPRVHAGDDRQVAPGFDVEVPLGELVGKSLVVLQQGVDRVHGAA